MSETPAYGAFGLPEHELRYQLEQELELAIRAQGSIEAPTAHAIAHSVARLLEQDHRRMLEQLERAGIRLIPDG